MQGALWTGLKAAGTIQLRNHLSHVIVPFDLLVSSMSRILILLTYLRLLHTIYNNGEGVHNLYGYLGEKIMYPWDSYNNS